MNGKTKFLVLALSIYSVLYFGVALMTSATFKDIAAIPIAGLPLAIWGGLVIIITGVIITRLHLKEMSDEETN